MANRVTTVVSHAGGRSTSAPATCHRSQASCTTSSASVIDPRMR